MCVLAEVFPRRTILQITLEKNTNIGLVMEMGRRRISDDLRRGVVVSRPREKFWVTSKRLTWLSILLNGRHGRIVGLQRNWH